MNLYYSSKLFFRWVLRVLKQFLLNNPKITISVIVINILLDFIRLIAFIIPLKVLLLAASPGIPSYLSFIDPAFKSEWLVGLSISALILYYFVIFLETHTTNISRLAGKKILRSASVLQVSSNSEKQVTNTFFDFCKMISNLIFFIAGCFLFLKLNVILLIFIASSVVLNALFVLKVVQSNSLRYSYINQKILVETKQYLNISSNMMFFGGFLVILTSFIQGYDNNALIAVISLILLRKVVANLSNAITIAKKLANKQSLNNALIFSSIPYVQSKVTFKGNSLLSLHNRSKRYSDVVLLFNQIKPNYKVLSVNWQDVTLHGIKILVVTTQAADGKNHIYLQQMIPPNLTNELSNEATLLNFIPREKLQMAETVHFFNLDIYSCRILDGGEKLGLDKILWPKVQRQLLTDIWSIKLPKELINIYQQTHQLLFKRLTSEVCDILNVAIDTQKEADLLAKFIAELPVLRKIISTHPLVLFNPDINMTNVLKEEQRYKVIFWGRWQLEPLGVALMRSGQHKDQFSSYIKKIAMRRKDTAGRLWKNDLELGALAFQWETYVKQEKYKQALLTMKKILNAIDTIVIKS